ncbi:MAG: hypothetical protein HY319_20565 [Armatimonadetes bacterium]|nr:hypothetical protein [Armatimonadota bacterium]
MRKAPISLFLGFLFFLRLTGAASAQAPRTDRAELYPPARDTMLRALAPHRNEGAHPRLGLGPGPHYRSLVAFDLTGLPLENLQSARLILSLSDPVTGLAGSETLEALRVNQPWVEGEGKDFGIPREERITGGGGATWYCPNEAEAPTDMLPWEGGESAVESPSAPAVMVGNDETGEVVFDVSEDVRRGAEHGWLIKKRGSGGNIFFYSREGAVLAGRPELAPRLALEFRRPAPQAGTAAPPAEGTADFPGESPAGELTAEQPGFESGFAAAEPAGFPAADPGGYEGGFSGGNRPAFESGLSLASSRVFLLSCGAMTAGLELPLLVLLGLGMGLAL